MNIIRGLLR